MLRVLAGLGALSAHHLLYEAAYRIPALAVAPLFAAASARGYIQLMLHYGTRLIAGYAAHSGLASVQIGWMRVAGYQVGERYRYPLFATNPVDFWRRWNTYIGSWARRYLFVPLSQWLRRRARWAPRPVVLALAVLVTFLGIGGAHDLILFVRIAGIGAPGGTVVFALHGLLLIAWLGVARLSSRSEMRALLRLPQALLSAGNWTLFMHALLLTLWLAIPSMSGEGLAAPLQELALFFDR